MKYNDIIKYILTQNLRLLEIVSYTCNLGDEVVSYTCNWRGKVVTVLIH